MLELLESLLSCGSDLFDDDDDGNDDGFGEAEDLLCLGFMNVRQTLSAIPTWAIGSTLCSRSTCSMLDTTSLMSVDERWDKEDTAASAICPAMPSSVKTPLTGMVSVCAEVGRDKHSMREGSFAGVVSGWNKGVVRSKPSA